MAITGILSEFSLPEVFQLLEQGHKTGLLTIKSLAGSPTEKGVIHYIWFHIGRVVGAANRLDGQGLSSMIQQRGWLSENVSSKVSLMCSAKSPLGLCLKSQGALQAEQLKLLFYGQVGRQVCALFKASDGLFDFNPQASLPMSEMTGLSLPATEVTLMGLRALRNWDALAEKLPATDSALMSLSSGKPHLRLDPQEWQVWEYVNGNLPLKTISEQLGIPVEKVQQIAFRLIVINLAEEIPIIEPEKTASTSINSGAQPGKGVEAGKDQLSHSFLQSLVGFLRTKV